MITLNKVRLYLIAGFVSLLLVLSTAHADKKLAVDKVEGPLSVIVLGSGGPIATAEGRASAGYLIFTDGKPRILMDAGGGSFQRLAASGATIPDLDIILLSHLHIDHMGDLSPMMKTIYFHARGKNIAAGIPFPPGRTAPVRIFGPNANGVIFPPPTGLPAVPQYPSSKDFVDGHFDANVGLDRYLNIFSRAISGGIFKYTVTNASPDWTTPASEQTLIDEDGLVVKSIGVNHGPVPALGFRIEYKGKSIVYSGDTSSKGDNMIALSQDADLLIYDTAITDTLPAATPGDGVFFALHTTPTRMGQVAAAAQVKKLVLSHLTPVTSPRIKEVKHLIRDAGYTGKIKAAKDLKVFNIEEDDDDDKDKDDD